MSALSQLLDTYRKASQTQREKGTYFEELMVHYFKNEPLYQDLYQEVWLYTEWAEQQQLTRKNDTGIDLVAQTRGTNELHAIQCKNYAEDYRLQKSDIDSFFTASGKTTFSQRIIISTTNHWSANAQDALIDQHPPVSVITLTDLENSQIDWAKYQSTHEVVLKAKKQLREHQTNALNSVKSGFATANRGKMIMACGTGKTLTSLKIAETIACKGKRILFLVPSLSLLSQTLTEWTQESDTPMHNFAVCSDSDVGKKRKELDDRVQVYTHELQFPATTNAKSLFQAMQVRHDSEHMTVVYSTYHSIGVIHEAQKQYGLPEFDLIICDEAHRTTGATFDGDDESAFVKIHDNDYVKGTKRLYMTATPRIYGDAAKETEGVTLCSMDDEALFGKEFYVISFSEAVARKLLVDYKVLVLAVEESHINRRLQMLLKDSNNQLKVDDAAKIIGCWKALSKQGITDDLIEDPQPMRRAVAFCQVIEKEYKGSKHKVSSKLISDVFGAVVAEYQRTEIEHLHAESPDALIDTALQLACDAQHVDGGMNAGQKESKLQWLKEEPPENTCRILSNVRCLSEGVDVPALDAVLFLTPRSSQVDVVQSVGRVMRRAEGKKQGYVILPVVIPAGVEPEKALDDNQTYKVVWQVLNALRAHDDRFDAMINKLEFNGSDKRKMEVIAIADKVQQKQKKQTKQQKTAGKARTGNSIGSDEPFAPPAQMSMTFEIGEIERALYAKIVKKCGNRHHWEDWANDIAKIASTHIDRIRAILGLPTQKDDKGNTTVKPDPSNPAISAYLPFANELRDDINNNITDSEIIEMLAQHLITKPVFDALFSQYSFAQHNPMSQAMQGVLDALNEHALDKEVNTLQSFYDSVKMRAEGIQTAEGKQRIVAELYEKFFKNAFPKLKDKLGIVYTPVAVVDFIIHSVEDVLNQEFNASLADKDVHIIDPFTGTGTFITRLLQSGIIPANKLPDKYKHEIHANEIVLLAYYIAAINIESVYHAILTGNSYGAESTPETHKAIPYTPFEGICLTDTFQMYEKEDLVDQILVENSHRRKRQKKLDIRVIIGNPPYSIGQANANNNNQNVDYPQLDERITNTYVANSQAALSKGLYDSYIRAIRWASDRIGNQGVIGYVSGSGFVEKSAMDGMRKTLVNEFTNIHVLNLRGDIRKNMLSNGKAKEGQNIFGSDSMTGIAITLFVKNPHAKEHGKIYYHNIGDDLTYDEKLGKITELASLNGITQAKGWQKIIPDGFNDWLNQRDLNFDNYISLGDKRDKTAITVFENYSLGVATNRDAWVYNSSRSALISNISRMINFYNGQVQRFNHAYSGLDKNSRKKAIDGFINTDPKQISWTRALKNELGKNQQFNFEEGCLSHSLYRPFTKQWLYFNRTFNEMVLQMPRIFPAAEVENLVICASGIGSRSGFSTLIMDQLPSLDTIEKGQCFPLYLYESTRNETKNDLFASAEAEPTLTRRDAITNEALEHFNAAYPNQSISKEDIFYYIYGLLHSDDYREKYADNLSKQLPRIPRVKSFADFSAFNQAGRNLAALHLNYETAAMPTNVQLTGSLGLSITPQKVVGGEDADFYVNKMKFAKKEDETKVIYNSKITIENIPEEAYNYVVNGKPALEWVMDRQAVKIDDGKNGSDITNDANDWAIETMQNTRYPLELFLRVITVSLETNRIVNSLPKLDI